MLNKVLLKSGSRRQFSSSITNFDPTKVIGKVYSDYKVDLSHKDSILYALGIGFSKNPLNRAHQRYTYENDKNF